MTRTNARRDQRGASAVEFALVFPMLAMVLFGTITSGISYSNAIGVTNAVREGSRFGATAEATAPTWAADVLARVRSTQFDDPTGETSICVQLWKQGSGAIATATQCSAGAAPNAAPIPTVYPAVPGGLTNGTCVVRVVAARPYTINAIFAQFDQVLTRSSVARYERDAC